MEKDEALSLYTQQFEKFRSELKNQLALGKISEADAKVYLDRVENWLMLGLHISEIATLENKQRAARSERDALETKRDNDIMVRYGDDEAFKSYQKRMNYVSAGSYEFRIESDRHKVAITNILDDLKNKFQLGRDVHIISFAVSPLDSIFNETKVLLERIELVFRYVSEGMTQETFDRRY